jgi:predicted aconitase
MQRLANLKLMTVLLAALAASSAVLFYHEHQIDQRTRQAQIAAQLERDREQIRKDDAEYRTQEALRKRVGAGK